MELKLGMMVVWNNAWQILSDIQLLHTKLMKTWHNSVFKLNGEHSFYMSAAESITVVEVKQKY